MKTTDTYTHYFGKPEEGAYTSAKLFELYPLDRLRELYVKFKSDDLTIEDLKEEFSDMRPEEKAWVLVINDKNLPDGKTMKEWNDVTLVRRLGRKENPEFLEIALEGLNARQVNGLVFKVDDMTDNCISDAVKICAYTHGVKSTKTHLQVIIDAFLRTEEGAEILADHFSRSRKATSSYVKKGLTAEQIDHADLNHCVAYEEAYYTVLANQLARIYTPDLKPAEQFSEALMFAKLKRRAGVAAKAEPAPNPQ